MRRVVIATWMLLVPLTPALAQLSINFGSPGVRIGFDLPVYPTLQRVPGYPVYYAPSVNTNYFFYDGLYWIYEGDNWYASSWYNGPWTSVDPIDVPLYVLRVPVRYYRHAPAYFRGWSRDAPPRWGDHWGQSWQQRHGEWDRWDRRSVPAAAPLPTYQRQYSGNRYPQPTQQAAIQVQSYRYQPRDPVAQQQFEHQRTQAQSAPPQQSAPRQQAAPQQQAQPIQRAPRQAAPQPQAQQRDERPPQQAPAAQQAPAVQQKPQPQRLERQTPAAQQEPKPQPQNPVAREQRAPQAQEKAPPVQEKPAPGKGQDKGEGKGQGKGQDKEKEKDKDKEKGQER